MSPERWAGRPEILRPVSEWAGGDDRRVVDQEEAADALLTRSLTLVHRCRGTLAALEAGALHPGHLWTMLEKVAPIAEARIRAEVEAELLRWAAGRVVTPAQLGRKARREVVRRDGAPRRRLERALKERGVHLRPHTVDGMATVTCWHPARGAGPAATRRPHLADKWTTDGDPHPGSEDGRLPPRPGVCARGRATYRRCRCCSRSSPRSGTLRGATPGEVDGQVVPRR